MITLKNITKYYDTDNGRKYIFKDASVVLPSMVNIGVLGKNGAGKSTFLRLIGGATYQDSGKLITDENISWPVGFKGCLQGGLTARQNTAFVCMLMQKDVVNTKKILDFVYHFSDLGNDFDLPVKTYSTGMKARLGFAVSLAFDFDTYLIDEILSVGDANFKKKSKEAIKEKFSNSRLIIVTHSAKKIKDYCSKVLLIKDGKFILYDDINEGLEEYKNIPSNAASKKDIDDDDD